MKATSSKIYLFLVFSFLHQHLFAQKETIFAIEEAYIEVLAQKYKGIIQSKVKVNIVTDTTNRHHILYEFHDLVLAAGLINFTGSNKQYYDIHETFNYAAIYLKHEGKWHLFNWFQVRKHTTYHENW